MYSTVHFHVSSFVHVHFSINKRQGRQGPGRVPKGIRGAEPSLRGGEREARRTQGQEGRTRFQKEEARGIRRGVHEAARSPGRMGRGRVEADCR